MSVDPAVNPRTARLLEGPIVPTLLKLAAPQLVLLLMQSSIGLIEAYGWVSWAPTLRPASRWCSLR